MHACPRCLYNRSCSNSFSTFEVYLNPYFQAKLLNSGFNCIFITSGKGSKISDKKAGLYKVQYIKIDGTNTTIYNKST